MQVVGCSGAVFGFMGLYVADMLLNFHSLSFPWLRLIWIAATLAYFVVASITQVSLPWAVQGTRILSMQHLQCSFCSYMASLRSDCLISQICCAAHPV